VTRGVVQDPHPATAVSAVAQEMPKEAAETEAIKFRLRLSDELPLAQVDSPKRGHGLSGGRM